ncbi:DUF1501 domain-containing protein [Tuwongella immobilis]|uniref:DUF1501 domain-containing protein n=1 Tax=Tuwongella immobilis TaxID=692036 RepID=A0A6C2YR65_9BACT|nr:DUF1501 domain-containing protein [Tuwongella immobilis]VIP04138.1 secreted protein containing duf1501 : Secreted protein containing DUF1501 OS=Rhodopirellula europaea 6C GN=RE6C_02964 PE=4 SV=1: DUF1501 [Tuwongella immobilis]VTS05641.1 secreted protein containing duf1501 : Secreted protein containing DUF1501 OS=Rhodopirellula europaea 6C GN=RE6C_02964 PE=4 SV=1: DUF1501 [Tuwongella immobilis]
MMNRRHFMSHVAGLSALAAPSASFLSGLHAQAPTMKKNHKSLIVLWMSGGPTTLDLWDPKPGHPNGGLFKPMNTAASGVQLTEHLPNVAKQMKNLALIRSLTTSEGDHMRGTQLMHTGMSPNPIVEYPQIGSVLAQQMAEQANDVPPFIAINGARLNNGGFLGMKYAPFTIQNPGSPPENIRPPKEVGEVATRMERRATLFNSLESRFQSSTGIPTDAAKAHKDVYDKALNLVVSSRKDVFSLDKEPTALQAEYGNNPFGKGCLLARKLVEAGSLCVQVELGGWDMHQNIFAALHTTGMTGRLDILDKAMGALTRDLKDRGLLESTVIMWMGEFGRTPRINQNGGRDHYPRAWSVVVGGGSIKGGQAFGATDAGGEAVKDNPVRIQDVFATVYKGLGLDPTTQVRDNLGRPMAIAGEGKPISALVG